MRGLCFVFVIPVKIAGWYKRKPLMRREDPRTRVVVYLLLTFAFSSYFYVQGHQHGLTAKIALGIMWCPGVAAIITSLLTGRSLPEIGWGWGKSKYQLAAWVIPML